MSRRFEMHVTTLNEGIKSHEPHTHRAEEIVLVLENKTEMQIGEKFFKGGEGDVYFLGSNVPHAIRNDGKGTCTYFAFQFE
jgi:(S)-ureidoglycine aminohydrolase